MILRRMVADILQSPPPSGPPYTPNVAVLGGVPTVNVDVPICAVLLVLFVTSAAGHMTLFQINKRKGHKFLFSVFLFGLSMARIATMSIRIAWTTNIENTSLAIASQVFTSAGVIILYVVNLIFAQRLIRASQPQLGWHRALSALFMALYALIVIMLIMIIVVTVLSFFSLDPNVRQIARDIQLATTTYFAIVTFLPVLIIALVLFLPRQTRVEKFGQGRWRTKIALLLTTSLLLTVGACFKCGTAWEPPRPQRNPAWYHAKWCYYVFNFVIELLVLYIYLGSRIDRRFHIPNGSKKAGDYRGKVASASLGDGNDQEKIGVAVDADPLKRHGSTCDDTCEDDDDDEYCNCSREGSMRSASPRPDSAPAPVV